MLVRNSCTEASSLQAGQGQVSRPGTVMIVGCSDAEQETLSIGHVVQ